MADLDWSHPLEAVDQVTGVTLTVAVDASYAPSHRGVPVRLPRNAWTGCADSGTWYFNDQGQAIGGISKDGYNGRYVLRNRSGGWPAN